MKILNIKSKLLLLSIIPLTIITIFSFMILDKIFTEKENLEISKKHIIEAGAIAKIVHYMQIERGHSVGYVSGVKKVDSLVLARKKLDNAINDAWAIFFKKNESYNGSIIKNLQDIKIQREKIDRNESSTTEVKNYYTKKIGYLLEIIKFLPSIIEDRENRNLIQSYSYLSSAKEALGQTRAVLNEVFIADVYADDNFSLFVENIGVYHANILNFTTIAPKEVLEIYKNGISANEVSETFKIIDLVIKHEERKNFNIEPSIWFEKSTKSIDFLHKIDLDLYQIVNESITQKLRVLSYKIFVVMIFFALTIIMIIVLIAIMMKKILSSTDLLEKEYVSSLSLLKQYKEAVDESSIVSKTDINGILTYVNHEFCKISGYEEYELIGKPHSIIKHHDMKKEIFEDLWHSIKDKKMAWCGEIKNRKKDGSSYCVKAYIKPILNNNGDILEYIGIRTDITNIVEQKALFEKAAKTDALTNYGNRYKLNSDIKEKENLSLALFNIDNFRQINDFYGHECGDRIIKSVADKICNFIAKEKNLFFYRLQGDEFAILSVEYEKERFLLTCKENLIILKDTFIFADKDVVLSCSCGISFEDKKNLLISADMALKMAKQKNCDFIVYDEVNSLNDEYENNIKCAKKLTTALQNDKFITFYQPIVNNDTLKHEKFEALIRMIDEDDKIISPFFFLEVAKKTKKYFDITKIVIRQSFEMFKESDAEFSINITIEDILNKNITLFIFKMLDNYDIGERVVFEIVESEYIQNFEEVLDFIKKVKTYGSKIAIDDFGTGYSNFEYLIKLQADYLKIDGSLIKNIDTDENSYLVVSTIVEFAKKLNMKTIAEFVENEQIFNKVQELGIDYSQGYHFGTPKKEIGYKTD